MGGVDWLYESDAFLLVIPRALIETVGVDGFAEGAVVLCGLATTGLDGPVASDGGTALVHKALIGETLLAGVEGAASGGVVGVQLEQGVEGGR